MSAVDTEHSDFHGYQIFSSLPLLVHVIHILTLVFSAVIKIILSTMQAVWRNNFIPLSKQVCFTNIYNYATTDTVLPLYTYKYKRTWTKTAEEFLIIPFTPLGSRPKSIMTNGLQPMMEWVEGLPSLPTGWITSRHSIV